MPDRRNSDRLERRKKNAHRLKICTWGTFDCLHDGHKEFLRKLSFVGELYVIVVPSKIKLENSGYLPRRNEFERKNDLVRFGQIENPGLIAGVFIDYFTNGLDSLCQINPHIFCLGYDQESQFDEKIIAFAHSHNLQAMFIRMITANGNGIHSSHFRKAVIKDEVRKSISN